MRKLTAQIFDFNLDFLSLQKQVESSKNARKEKIAGSGDPIVDQLGTPPPKSLNSGTKIQPSFATSPFEPSNWSLWHQMCMFANSWLEPKKN